MPHLRSLVVRMTFRPRALASLLLLGFLAACGGSEEGGDLPAGVVSVEEVGLLAPRAAIHDPVADVYLVTNMNGGALDADQNGFVSRISPEGEVLALTWIAPAPGPTALSAPRGLALRGDSLLVADIDCIGIFHRVSGEAEGRQCIDGATSLSGLDVGPEGSLFATDAGYQAGAAGMTASGTASVYRLVLSEDRRGSTLAQGADLGHPLGLDVGSRGIFVATAEPGQILRLTPEGERTPVLTVPAARFEGVVVLADGGFAYTTSHDGAVHRVDGSGELHTLVEGLDGPGDPGYDATRNRLLVPLTGEDRLLLIDLSD